MFAGGWGVCGAAFGRALGVRSGRAFGACVRGMRSGHALGACARGVRSGCAVCARGVRSGCAFIARVRPAQ
ncbi:hypothetical protein EMIT0158MI4_40219 [Burkholderia ambifaria]